MRFPFVLMIVLSCCAAARGAQPAGREPPVELGVWHCIGPLKDAAFGIARTSFDTPFAPEWDVLRAGRGPIELDKTLRGPEIPQRGRYPTPLAATPRVDRRLSPPAAAGSGAFQE